MGYTKKTLRRMTPIARKVAKLANEADLVSRRLKKLVEDIQHLEIDSLALFEQKKAQGNGEVKPEELDWLDASILSKVVKE